MKIEWETHVDETDNDFWEAPSPYHDEGTPIYWRIKQRLWNNSIEFYLCHDSELDECESFDSLKDAKNHVQKGHESIVKEEVEARKKQR